MLWQNVSKYPGSIPPCVAPTKNQHYLISMGGHMAYYLDQASNNCPYPSPLYRMLAPLRPMAFQRLLSDHLEHVICEYNKFNHELIRIEFSGRKPLDIHVSLNLAVVLLAFDVGVITIYDVIIIPFKVCQDGITFNIRNSLPVILWLSLSVSRRKSGVLH